MNSDLDRLDKIITILNYHPNVIKWRPCPVFHKVTEFISPSCTCCHWWAFNWVSRTSGAFLFGGEGGFRPFFSFGIRQLDSQTDTKLSTTQTSWYYLFIAMNKSPWTILSEVLLKGGDSLNFHCAGFAHLANEGFGVCHVIVYGSCQVSPWAS